MSAIHAPALRLAGLWAILGFLLGCAVSPSAAVAGSWTQLVCAANGAPAPVDGLSPASAGTSATATDRCDPGNGGLVALVSSATAVAPGTASSWTYTAPAGSTITGGSISLALFAPGGTAYVATPSPTLDSADVLAECAGGTSCGSSVGGQLTEVVPIAHPGGRKIYAIAECTGYCPAGGGGAGLFAQVNVFGMSIELANGATPTGSAFGGGLLNPGAAGIQSLSLRAADPGGPGVFEVTVTIDGQTVYAATPDSAGGHCAPVGKDASGIDEWLYAQPCPTATGASIPIDTTQLPDGQHALRVTVTDAAGNSADVLDRTVTTTNAGTASQSQAGSLGGCNAPVLSAGFGTGTALHVTLRHGATLRGTLTCAGKPIGGAQITLSISRAGELGPPQATTVRTAQDGSFTFQLTPGPSRTVTLSYAPLGAGAISASASVRLDVTPSISLSIAPGHVRNGQTITYRGQVLGGYIPRAGLPLDLEFRDGARWRIFDQTRARATSGSFVYRYTFRRTTVPIVYTFRVAIPAGGVHGYPFSPTASRARSVRVDP